MVPGFGFNWCMLFVAVRIASDKNHKAKGVPLYNGAQKPAICALFQIKCSSNKKLLLQNSAVNPYCASYVC